MRYVHTLLILSCITAVCAGAEPVRLGAFTATLAAENALLPDSIRWDRDGQEAIELLADAVPLNLTFTDFAYRNKFYREEDRDVWGDRESPRMVTEPVLTGDNPVPAEAGEYAGVTVSYTTSYGGVQRHLLAHRTEPKLRIRYQVTAGRELLVHEADMFGAKLRFAEPFSSAAVIDIRNAGAPLLNSSAEGGVRYGCFLVNHGPVLVSAGDPAAHLVLSYEVSGDLPEPVPARLIMVKPGKTFAITIDIACFAKRSEAEAALRAAHQARPDSDRAYRLTTIGDMLVANGEPKAAEAAYHEAAAADRAYASPYAKLARIPRIMDPDEARLSFVEAYVEAAYRMPYNYGYILSGGGITGNKQLSEAQRRLAVFNKLICLENTLFYTDYYIWGAGDFRALNMPAQECAMYRQALWALQYMPRPEEYKAKKRKAFEKRIAELEEQLRSEIKPDLPELIEVRTPAMEAAQPPAE